MTIFTTDGTWECEAVMIHATIAENVEERSSADGPVSSEYCVMSREQEKTPTFIEGASATVNLTAPHEGNIETTLTANFGAGGHCVFSTTEAKQLKVTYETTTEKLEVGGKLTGTSPSPARRGRKSAALSRWRQKTKRRSSSVR